jgi:hypothetical protein
VETTYLPSSPHLGRDPRAPGWIRLPSGRGLDDRFWLFFTDPHPSEKMEWHKALQQLKAQPATVLGRGWSLTSASSRSNFLTLLGSGLLVKNSMSAICGELCSAHYPTPGTGHSRRETELHWITLSSTMWSRKWQRLEGISCIKQRVLLIPARDSLVPNTSQWLVIQNPPLEIWVTDVIHY